MWPPLTCKPVAPPLLLVELELLVDALLLAPPDPEVDPLLLAPPEPLPLLELAPLPLPAAMELPGDDEHAVDDDAAAAPEKSASATT